jgi:hypothetical protein
MIWSAFAIVSAADASRDEDPRVVTLCASSSLAGAERSSALQRAMLALVMPTSRRDFAPGDLQFLTSSTYRRAERASSADLASQRSAVLVRAVVKSRGPWTTGPRYLACVTCSSLLALAPLGERAAHGGRVRGSVAGAPL